MSFLTPEKMRAVRLKGAETVALERFDMKLLVVVAGSAAALEIREKQKAGLAEKELFPLLLQAGIAKENGDLLTAGEVGELMQVLSVDEMMLLTSKVNEKIIVNPQKGSPTPSSGNATSSTTSASPSAVPTPIT